MGPHLRESEERWRAADETPHSVACHRRRLCRLRYRRRCVEDGPVQAHCSLITWASSVALPARHRRLAGRGRSRSRSPHPPNLCRRLNRLKSAHAINGCSGARPSLLNAANFTRAAAAPLWTWPEVRLRVGRDSARRARPHRQAASDGARGATRARSSHPLTKQTPCPAPVTRRHCPRCSPRPTCPCGVPEVG
jgi:hypothetical protein